MKLKKGQAVYIRGREYIGEVPDEYLSDDLRKILEKGSAKKEKKTAPKKDKTAEG